MKVQTKRSANIYESSEISPRVQSKADALEE